MEKRGKIVVCQNRDFGHSYQFLAQAESPLIDPTKAKFANSAFVRVVSSRVKRKAPVIKSLIPPMIGPPYLGEMSRFLNSHQQIKPQHVPLHFVEHAGSSHCHPSLHYNEDILSGCNLKICNGNTLTVSEP